MSPVAVLILAACAPKTVAPEPAPAPAPPPAPTVPTTARIDVTDTVQGVSSTDPYRWLEDEKSPETQAWMKAQDDFARARLAELPGRDKLTKRLTDLYAVDAVSAPQVRGTRLFYMRQFKDKDKAVLYWRDGDGAEKVLLDPNTWGGSTPMSLGDWVPSWDGRQVAFQENPNHADEATQYVIDVDSGTISTVDIIPGAKYASPSWTPDGKAFYYEWVPTDASISTDQRPGYTECRYHVLGTDPAKDPVVHEKTGDAATFLDCSLSRDGRYLFATTQHGWAATDVAMRDLKKDKTWRPVVEGKKNLYFVEEWKDSLYIYTDEAGARKHVFKTTAAKPDRATWKEIVPEEPEASLEGYAIVGDHLVLEYLHDVQSEVRITDLDGKGKSPLQLPAIGSVAALTGTYDSDAIYYQFSNFTTPPTVYRTSVKTPATSTVWAKVEVPVDPSAYTVEQVWYPSKDGTKIPMFLVHRADAVKNGQNPTLLYGYGGFDVSLTPDFKSRLYPWLEAGGVYAIANLRGGGEFGEAWHQAGMLDKKQNVFDDFAAAAQYLESSGWTSPQKLAIQGGSNGGLLMGTAMTQHPELYKAVVCQVPLLDMVRYHLFGSGRTWIPEYGTAEDPEQYKFIAAYSPYQAIKPGTTYPALLMMSADHDDRVDPMHARKFVAAVQHDGVGGAPTWLRIERNAGHTGADAVSQTVAYYTDLYSFLFAQLGMNP